MNSVQFKIVSSSLDKINKKLGDELNRAEKGKKTKISSIFKKELKSLKKAQDAVSSNVGKLTTDQKDELIDKINNIRKSLVKLDPKGKQGAEIDAIVKNMAEQIYPHDMGKLDKLPPEMRGEVLKEVDARDLKRINRTFRDEVQDNPERWLKRVGQSLGKRTVVTDWVEGTEEERDKIEIYKETAGVAKSKNPEEIQKALYEDLLRRLEYKLGFDDYEGRHFINSLEKELDYQLPPVHASYSREEILYGLFKALHDNQGTIMAPAAFVKIHDTLESHHNPAAGHLHVDVLLSNDPLGAEAKAVVKEKLNPDYKPGDVYKSLRSAFKNSKVFNQLPPYHSSLFFESPPPKKRIGPEQFYVTESSKYEEALKGESTHLLTFVTGKKGPNRVRIHFDKETGNFYAEKNKGRLESPTVDGLLEKLCKEEKIDFDRAVDLKQLR